MRKALAVAALDVKRLWLAIGGIGIALGIAPTLVGYFGTLGARGADLAFGFLAAAVAGAAATCGFVFGNDFSEGKPSFFFARPLPSGTLLAGRLAAMIALCAIAAIGFSAAYSVAGRAPLLDVFRQIPSRRLALVPVVWIVCVFFSLAQATSLRQTQKRTLRGMGVQFFRGSAGIAISAFMFVLFFDVSLRASQNSPEPFVWLGGSYALAAFVAVCVAIDRGRTDRLRIARLMTICMYVHAVLAAIVVAIAWAYILHPPPAAVRDVASVTSSPDGRMAYVAARVDRGGKEFMPFFNVNLDSGEVERLATEYDSGWRPWLWYSRDGSTKVWAEQRPLLFGLAQRALMGASVFRFQAAFGQPTPLRMPDEIEFDTNFPLTMRPEIMPASGSDLVAVIWNYRGRGQKLAFVSASRGTVSAIDLVAERRTITAWAFRPSGRLRAAASLGTGPDRRLQIIDIDPATGAISVVFDQIPGPSPRVRFDAFADRAIVITGAGHARSFSLIGLGDSAPSSPPAPLASGRENNVEEAFLADGSVALIVRQPPTSDLQVFSPDGKQLFRIPLGVGFSRLGNQPFASTLTILTNRGGRTVLSFIDAVKGTTVREMEGFYAPQLMAARWWLETPPPPPGTPGARVLLSADRRLVMLPSLSEEPRQLLPRQ